VSRRRYRGEDQVEQSNWLMTYGDMITLILAFFVILYSFSTIDNEKFDMAVVSLKGALGILKSGQAIVEQQQRLPQERSEAPPFELDWRQLREVQRRIEELLQELGLKGVIALSVEERGLVIRFAENVLFDSGRAELKPEAREVLDRIAVVLQDIPNQLRIEGHTDNVPISTPEFPSNWELSTRRATSVLRYLVEERQISPYRVSAAGYGEYRPIGDNSTPEGRQLNRRVDIVILHMLYSTREPQ